MPPISPPPPTATEHGVEVRRLLRKLERRACPGPPCVSTLIERVDRHRAGRLAPFDARRERLGVALADDRQVGAVQADAVDLGGRRHRRHEDARAGSESLIARTRPPRRGCRPDAATTPLFGGWRVRRFANAPRVLNEPACCSCSSFSVSANGGSPKSAPLMVTTGVRRMCGGDDRVNTFDVGASDRESHERRFYATARLALKSVREPRPRIALRGDQQAYSDDMTRIRIVLVFAGLLSPAPSCSTRSRRRHKRRYKFTEISARRCYSAIGTGSMNVGSNSAVIVNRDEVMIVDSHISPESGRAMLQELKAITDKPVRFLDQHAFPLRPHQRQPGVPARRRHHRPRVHARGS